MRAARAGNDFIIIIGRRPARANNAPRRIGPAPAPAPRDAYRAARIPALASGARASIRAPPGPRPAKPSKCAPDWPPGPREASGAPGATWGRARAGADDKDGPRLGPLGAPATRSRYAPGARVARAYSRPGPGGARSRDKQVN